MPTEPLSHLVLAVQAASYLDGPEAALKVLGRRAPRLQSRRERLTTEKLRADLRLTIGDVDGLGEVRAKLGSYHTPADLRFDDLISGARVLVLGPSPRGRPTDEQIAGFDVVATTKRPISSEHPLTQLIYPTDGSARLEGMIDERSPRGREEMLVLRPSIIAHHGRPVPFDPSIRVMSCEDANTFLGTHFGIQRILYDLVGRGARAIQLAGVDFFLSDSPYMAGYANEIEAIFNPRGLQPNASIAPHDYVADFEFTKCLAEGGIVSCVPGVRSLLNLDRWQYVERLSSRLRAESRPSPEHEVSGARPTPAAGSL